MVNRIKSSRLRTIVRKQALYIVFGLVIALCGCEERKPQDQPSGDGEKFIVMVVGDGVPPVDKDNARIWPLNRAQGEAMYKGVLAALNDSPSLKSLTSIIQIEGKDDRGDPERAAELAEELRRNPRVLAVIGHATSGTTLHAVWRYNQAGIPIIMPIATSPELMYHPKKTGLEEHRFRNVFRLLPSDDKGQAPAVTHLIRKLGLKKVYLINDATTGAWEYSRPLRESLEPYIRKEVLNKLTEVQRETTDFTKLASSIQAQNADSVVFCGYATTALELLGGLDQIYAGVSREKRPTIILTDGCLIPDLDAKGFNLYLTFPHVEIPDCADKRDLEILREISNHTKRISYEVFAYDAMLILGSAIQTLRENGIVDRKSLIDYLNSSKVFVGTAGLYEFEKGENRMAQYDILHNVDTGQLGQCKFEVNEVVTAQKLQEIRSEKH